MACPCTNDLKFNIRFHKQRAESRAYESVANKMFYLPVLCLSIVFQMSYNTMASCIGACSVLSGSYLSLSSKHDLLF